MCKPRMHVQYNICALAGNHRKVLRKKKKEKEEMGRKREREKDSFITRVTTRLRRCRGACWQCEHQERTARIVRTELRARRFILTIVNARTWRARCYTWRSLKLNEISTIPSFAVRQDGENHHQWQPVLRHDTTSFLPRIYASGSTLYDSKRAEREREMW